jgi:hypothetical protein
MRYFWDLRSGILVSPWVFLILLALVLLPLLLVARAAVGGPQKQGNTR